MSKNFWTNPDDFDDDMLEHSVFNDGSFERYKHKPSKHYERIRSKQSIMDDLPDEVEQETMRFVRPGRGYPLIRQRDDLRTPGGVPSFVHQYETTKEIREVCGLGFSNDLIEHSLKGPSVQIDLVTENKREVPDVHVTSSPTSDSSSGSTEKKRHMPDIGLRGSPTSDTSSKYSTPSSSPLHTTSNEQSPLRRPQFIHKQDKQISAPSIYVPQTKNNKAPPPLYEIVKSKNDKPVEKQQRNHRMVNCYKSMAEKPKKADYLNSLFMIPSDKSYNIDSKRDFPDLS